MSDTPMKLIVDCATGAQTYVPLTEEEIAQREADALAAEEAEAERVAAEEAREALKASARQKLISGQPLTEEEAALLVL